MDETCFNELLSTIYTLNQHQIERLKNEIWTYQYSQHNLLSDEEVSMLLKIFEERKA